MREIIKIPSKHFTDLVEVSFLNYPLPAFMFFDVPSDVCLHSFLYSVTDSIINTLLMFMHRLGREFDKPAVFNKCRVNSMQCEIGNISQ